MPGWRTALSRKSSLLSRYSETLGELTFRRKTELALLAARNEADAASRAKSAFLATMSHELRTPLNAIIGFSDLIRHQDPSASGGIHSADYAAQIAAAGRHLNDVISDVLDLSRIESGALHLSRDACDLGEIVDMAVSAMAAPIADKQQTLDVEIARDLPELDLDARRIRQVLLKLLSNATKFTPERGRILLAARREADGGVLVSVADTGIGMTQAQIEIAMQPFAQVQAHHGRSQEGMGLGLPIASGLIGLHGGRLQIASEAGIGTCVRIWLPTRAASARLHTGGTA